VTFLRDIRSEMRDRRISSQTPKNRKPSSVSHAVLVVTTNRYENITISRGTQ